ncbi:MAG: lytic murein transglycosylase B [Pseudomonadota bacterium]
MGRQRTELLILALLACASHAAQQGVDLARQDVQDFVGTMVTQHKFDREELNSILQNAVFQQRIVDAIQRPAEKTLAWWEYRARFMTDERINAGVQVLTDNREALDRISQDSGVPPEYLVAITGVETFFGRITGRYRVLDSLVTLGFDYPPRGGFFRRELEQYLVMTREEGLDPRVPLGSYAGAMGLPQFMPSSFRAYAVDGNGDAHRDLWQSWPDAFASIANYFKQHGWRVGQPVLADAAHENSTDDPAAAKLTLNETVAGLRQRGYQFETSLPASAPAMLVPAALEQGMSWRVGFQNFFVITRYNRSPLYAMAVHDLAQAIAARDVAARASAGAALPSTSPAATITPTAAEK